MKLKLVILFLRQGARAQRRKDSKLNSNSRWSSPCRCVYSGHNSLCDLASWRLGVEIAYLRSVSQREIQNQRHAQDEEEGGGLQVAVLGQPQQAAEQFGRAIRAADGAGDNPLV